MDGEITGYTFDGVHVDFSAMKSHGVIGIYQDDDAIETTAKNMNEICIQWLALHDPGVLKGGE